MWRVRVAAAAIGHCDSDDKAIDQNGGGARGRGVQGSATRESPGAPSKAGTARPEAPVSRRFYGTADLDPARVGRDAGKVAEEIIAHLAGLVGSEVRITMEIEAQLPNGVTDSVMRIVTENSRTLKFKNHGFEAH